MKPINILHLYPNEMNTYGDYGNVLTLSRRLEWHGYQPKIHYHHPGKALPETIDLVIGGGGQDSAQTDVQVDILKIGRQMHELASEEVPMLIVCGTYQLFGHRYLTHEGVQVKGIGIFNAETIGGPKRMIGNVMAKSDFGVIFGFENHSGQTRLGAGQEPFATVIRGNGNNGEDKTEGARTNNALGTYLHGPFLPNNPIFCDELIRLACQKRYGSFEPKPINDDIGKLAASAAKHRRY
ncbi:glutamine amidotransferase [Candidatus Saccharibacteria bacterium]|nr:glutamine amidotransferase [Candidatus Saccharibacteria bacterium]